MQEWIDFLRAQATDLGLNVVAALAILVLGRYASKIVKKILHKIMERGNVDPTLVSFVCNISYVALIAFVVVAALNRLGIQTASFIAILGAASLAVGMALQGSLSNFAAGVLMIIFRPISVGDYIEAAGTAGTVETIEIFTTKLLSPDHKTIIIPNAKLTGGNIVNYTRQGTRRVDMVFSVSYGDDLSRVKEVMADVIAKDPRVLPDKPVLVAVSALADSSVDLVARPWVNADDYWGFYFDTMETMKKRFDEEGISIPFPQRDVHLIGAEGQ
ncbi:MAG: mechanosensitive ion channel domain-containing protein [Thermodesulfobacteriota bacterium]